MNYFEQMFSLKGKSAIISGGAGVIGLVMSEALLKAGANIMIWSRSQESLDKALDHLNSIVGTEGRVEGVRVDTGLEDKVKVALKEADNHFGRVDILVNGVGGNIGKSALVDTDMETFQKVLHMNLVAGLMVPTKIIGAYWIEKKIRGAIINITSMASYNPLSGVWAYDAAKSATLNLTMGSANEFAQYGIRVNAIAPGLILETPLHETFNTDEGIQGAINSTPLKRGGTPDDVANAILYFVTNLGSFITGEIIEINGGLYFA